MKTGERGGGGERVGSASIAGGGAEGGVVGGRGSGFRATTMYRRGCSVLDWRCESLAEGLCEVQIE